MKDIIETYQSIISNALDMASNDFEDFTIQIKRTIVAGKAVARVSILLFEDGESSVVYSTEVMDKSAEKSLHDALKNTLYDFIKYAVHGFSELKYSYD